MKFDNYLLKLNNSSSNNKESICLHGCSQIINSLYDELKYADNNISTKEICRLLDVPYQTFYCWISGKNPTPISKLINLLEIWAKTCGKSKKDVNLMFNNIYASIIFYSQNGQRKVKLPKEFDVRLGYLVGFFQGDGHLKKENKKGFQEHSIYFYEAQKLMMKSLNNILLHEFGIKGNVYYQTNELGSWYTLRICSKPVYLFFRDILGLQSGKKLRNVSTPLTIKNSSLPIQQAFIRGFFDAEGAVGETSKNPWLAIGQASKNSPPEILVWIKNKLKQFNIRLSEPKRTINQEFFRIRTSKRETIKTFFETISSEHPKKIKIFKEIIKKC